MASANLQHPALPQPVENLTYHLLQRFGDIRSQFVMLDVRGSLCIVMAAAMRRLLQFTHRSPATYFATTLHLILLYAYRPTERHYLSLPVAYYLADSSDQADTALANKSSKTSIGLRQFNVLRGPSRSALRRLYQVPPAVTGQVLKIVRLGG